MKEQKPSDISIIGATGFIGSSLTEHVLSARDQVSNLYLAVRNPYDDIFPARVERFKRQRPDKKIEILHCDHLNLNDLKRAVARADIVYDPAGLAWQHPGTMSDPETLLSEQLMQNSYSACLVGRIIHKEQVLVWTSTSAVTAMLSKLPYPELKIFNNIVRQLVNDFFLNLDVERNNTHDLKKIMINVVRNLFEEFFSFIVANSYAFSKYIGQTILEKLSQKNIRVLNISDIYGPGQRIESDVLDPSYPARRIQRFVAAYRQIKKNRVEWIPDDGSSAHGFSKTKKGIIQNVWNDFLCPAYITDVCELMIQATEIPYPGKVVLDVNGNRLSNFQMARAIRDFFGVDVEVKKLRSLSETPEKSQDLRLFKLPHPLISFKEGLEQWLTNVV